jgi:hypothetical protein
LNRRTLDWRWFIPQSGEYREISVQTPSFLAMSRPGSANRNRQNKGRFLAA